MTTSAANEIPFTQYLRPDGRQKAVVIERPKEIVQEALKLISEHKCRFDIEVLTTGDVSMTCEQGRGRNHRVLSWEICPNGPAVPEAVDRLVQKASEACQASVSQ